MKKHLLPLFLLLFVVGIGGCAKEQDKNSKEETSGLEQVIDAARYKLYPTQNMWTFIKLDTQTGQMWQVQYSLDENNPRVEYDLNNNVLMPQAKKINGRFELQPTQNIFNFILLDRIDGKLWQVQWSLDEEKAGCHAHRKTRVNINSETIKASRKLYRAFKMPQSFF